MGYLIISHIRAIDIDRSMVTPSTGYVHKTTVSIRVVDVWLSTCDKKILILEGHSTIRDSHKNTLRGLGIVLELHIPYWQSRVLCAIQHPVIYVRSVTDVWRILITSLEQTEVVFRFCRILEWR